MANNSQVLIREENKEIQQTENHNIQRNSVHAPAYKSITSSIINQNPYEWNLGARKFRDLFMKKNLNSDTNQRLKKTYKPFYMSDDD